MLKLVTVPCLEDNYAFLLHDEESRETALIDAPEAAPILATLKDRGWQLSQIWLTHHHWDHVEGVEELRQKTGAKVVGAKADAHRLPVLDAAYDAMEIFDFSGHSVKVFDVSGHTLNHIAFYVADAQAAFTGDSLMAMGCGRLFEGSPAQMHQSLSQLASLPAETLICSGHEYTSSNAKFALTIEPNNPALLTRIADIKTARDNGIATVPSLLADELASNPFLRAHSAEIKTTLGLQDATEVEVFTQIRLRKDNF